MKPRKMIEKKCKELGLKIKSLTYTRCSVGVWYDCSVAGGEWGLCLENGDEYGFDPDAYSHEQAEKICEDLDFDHGLNETCMYCGEKFNLNKTNTEDARYCSKACEMDSCFEQGANA